MRAVGVFWAVLQWAVSCWCLFGAVLLGVWFRAGIVSCESLPVERLGLKFKVSGGVRKGAWVFKERNCAVVNLLFGFLGFLRWEVEIGLLLQCCGVMKLSEDLFMMRTWVVRGGFLSRVLLG